MKGPSIYLILILILFGCNNNPGSGSKVLVQKEKSTDHDSSIYVVLTYDPKTNFHKEEYSLAVLSELDISDIQSLLEKSVNDHNSKGNSNINLSEYKRQYMAVINKKNEKEVWVSCSCNGYFGLVKDGGKCYFNLKLNLTKKSFTKITTNGSA